MTAKTLQEIKNRLSATTPKESGFMVWVSKIAEDNQTLTQEIERLQKVCAKVARANIFVSDGSLSNEIEDAIQEIGRVVEEYES